MRGIAGFILSLVCFYAAYFIVGIFGFAAVAGAVVVYVGILLFPRDVEKLVAKLGNRGVIAYNLVSYMAVCVLAIYAMFWAMSLAGALVGGGLMGLVLSIAAIFVAFFLLRRLLFAKGPAVTYFL